MSKSKGGGGRQGSGGGSGATQASAPLPGSETTEKLPAGMTHAQMFEQKANEIIDNPIERGIIIDKDDNVITILGTNDFVEFNSNQINRILNSPSKTVLHNHPSGESLSFGDFIFYNNYGATIQAVGRSKLTGKKYVYEFFQRRGPTDENKIKTAFDKATNTVAKRRAKRVASGKMTEAQYGDGFWHEVWTSVNKKYNVGYARREI